MVRASAPRGDACEREVRRDALGEGRGRQQRGHQGPHVPAPRVRRLQGKLADGRHGHAVRGDRHTAVQTGRGRDQVQLG